MKRIVFVAMLVLASCASGKSGVEKTAPLPGENLPEIFELTTDTQYAVFYIKTGYSGCAGTGMPIVDRGSNEPRTLLGDFICFDGAYDEEIMNAMSGKGGDPEIKIAAQIYLVHQSGFAPIDPELGEEVYWYYEAKVVQLGGIYVTAEP
jgi:hypothetical protein